MDARTAQYDIVLPEDGGSAEDWALHGQPLRDILEAAGWRPEIPTCLLGSRVTDAAAERLTSRVGAVLVDDPAKAAMVVVADTSIGIERTVLTIAPELAPEVEVLLIDWSLATWPALEQRGRAFVYRPGDRSTWARFLESHLLALVHPTIDGFLVARCTAHMDLPGFSLSVGGDIEPYLTPHYLESDLQAGQRRQVDLEIHPGLIPRRGVTGTLDVLMDGAPIGVSETITMAPSKRVQCVLSGHDEGPIAGRRLERAIRGLHRGTMPATLLAARIWLADKRSGDSTGT